MRILIIYTSSAFHTSRAKILERSHVQFQGKPHFEKESRSFNSRLHVCIDFSHILLLTSQSSGFGVGGRDELAAEALYSHVDLT